MDRSGRNGRFGRCDVVIVETVDLLRTAPAGSAGLGGGGRRHGGGGRGKKGDSGRVQRGGGKLFQREKKRLRMR